MEDAFTSDRGLSIPRVAGALLAIAVLALALPYAMVSSLHARRLARADRQLAVVAAALNATTASMPAAAALLTGRGFAPVANREWTAAPSAPLSSVIDDPGPDPWGNAYLVVLVNGRAVWAISAGPDGVLQTPLARAGVAAGDDRIAPISSSRR